MSYFSSPFVKTPMKNAKMKNYRYVIAFCGSLFVYISFGVLLLIFSHYKNVIKKESQTSIIFDLAQFEQSKVTKNTKVMPQTPAEQEMPKPAEQKSIVKETIQQPKNLKPISKPLNKNQNEQTSASSSTNKIDAVPNLSLAKQNISQTTAPKQINSGTFEAMVKNRINQYKFYPPIAKNRGIEGVIEASFVILPNGNVADIKLSGPNALKSAAREAINRAFPIDVSNCPISLPTTMHISLRYSLLSEN
jgi:protein TonB